MIKEIYIDNFRCLTNFRIKPGDFQLWAKQLLEDVLPGFEQVSLREIGESRKLTVTFRINDKDHDFDFREISDGQRQLIVLYTVLETLRAGLFSTVIIDEPDNFVSLREIQPWLENLNDFRHFEDI